MKRKFFMNIIALIAAFSFLPMMISASCSLEYENTDPEVQNRYAAYTDVCDISLFLPCRDELRVSGTFIQRIRSVYGVRSRQQFYLWYICGGSCIISTALIIYAIIRLVHENIRSSRKYIIEYIHDKDGDKLLHSVLQ